MSLNLDTIRESKCSDRILGLVVDNELEHKLSLFYAQENNFTIF